MPTPRPPRPWTALALLLAVVLLAAHGPVLVGARTWSDDHYVAEVAPARLATVDAIASGRLPGWWERAGLGAPLWAEPADGAAYPGFWPAALAPDHAAWLIDALGALHVLAAAVGVALLARRLGADDLGALVAGAWFAVSDVASGAIVGGAIGAVAWLPWAAWAAGEISGAGPGDASTKREPGRSPGSRHQPASRAANQVSRKLRGLVALTIAIAMMVATGRWTIAIDGVLVALVFAARGRVRVRAIAWAGGAAFLGIGLAAIALVPAILHVTGDVGTAASPGPSGWNLLELVMPHARDLGVASNGGVWIGGAAVALAALAAWRNARLVGLAGATFALATIASPDHAAAAAVLIAALAGVGFTGARDPRGIVIAILALAVGVAALAIARPMLAHHQGGDLDAAVARVDSVIAHAAVASVIAAAALGLLLVTARVPQALPAAAVLIVGHAVILSRLAHPTVARGDLDSLPTLLVNLPAQPANGLSPRLYRPLDMPDAGDPHETLAGAVATRFGDAAVRWPAPGRRAIEDALWRASATGGRLMLDRFAIDLALVRAGSANDFTVLGERGEWSLIATGAKRTRAFLAPATRWFSDDAAAIAAMFPSAGNLYLALGVVARVGDGTDSGPDDAQPEPCDVRAPRPEHVIVHCDQGGGTIGLADAWAPGWSVTVDGAPAALARIDVAARGVEVPAGAHVADFEYTPPGLPLGRWISLASLFALTAIVALRWRRT